KRWPQIAQAQDAAGDREGEIAEGLVQLDAGIFRARLGQHRVAAARGPVEGAAIDDYAADGIAVTAEKFRRRMHDDVGAMPKRPAEIGRGEGVIDDERHARLLRDVRDGL